MAARSQASGGRGRRARDREGGGSGLRRRGGRCEARRERFRVTGPRGPRRSRQRGAARTGGSGTRRAQGHWQGLSQQGKGDWRSREQPIVHQVDQRHHRLGSDRIDPGTDRGRTEAYVPAFISPESHIGSGHTPHSISHRPGWRSRHTGPAAGNPALPGESFRRSSMSLPASLAFATALLDGGTMPLSESCRRTLDSIRRLNPCAR